MRDDFAVFILTHGRPDKQLTLNSFRQAGYTGRIYLVLDDQDETIYQYIDNYGAENIIVFDKNYYINSVDVGSNNPPFKCILYAKCAVEDIARELRLSAFVITDDDMTGFRYRYREGTSLKSLKIRHTMDNILDEYIDFVINTNMSMISFGGATIYFNSSSVFSNEDVQKWRIPFSVVIRNTNKRVDWRSAFSEDIITGLQLAKIGDVNFSLPFVQFDTAIVGGNTGGMDETYKNNSSVKRAMYDVMYEPSSAAVKMIRGKYLPVYYKDKAFPKIVSTKYHIYK